MTTKTCTYRHHPGYGRDDHRAAEVVARAARELGLAGAEDAVRRACGFAPTRVPVQAGCVSIPAVRGAVARMRQALKVALEATKADIWIEVVVVR